MDKFQVLPVVFILVVPLFPSVPLYRAHHRAQKSVRVFNKHRCNTKLGKENRQIGQRRKVRKVEGHCNDDECIHEITREGSADDESSLLLPESFALVQRHFNDGSFEVAEIHSSE